MRLRARHLACVLLLLSSIGAAQGSALPARHFGLGGRYIDALLDPDACLCGDYAPQGRTPHFSAPQSLRLPSASRATERMAWTMRPAAAHSALLHAVTGLAPAATL